MTAAKIPETVARIGLRVPEAAAAVGLSVDTINKAIKSNELTAKYSGTKPLISPDELRRWFDSLPEEKPQTGR